MRDGDGLEACGLRVLHCQVPEAADAEHSHALMRLRIGPAEPAIDGITSAKDRRCLLVGNLVGNKVGCVGIHQHVLGVSALCLNPCALQIRTEHFAATLAPFAASASGLNPGGAHTVADLSRGDVGSHGSDLADRLVAEDSRKWPGQVSESLVNV